MKADALVLFGATGDLAKKKLFPALYDLEELDELDVKIFGVASSKWTQEVFRENVETAIRARKPDADEKVLGVSAIAFTIIAPAVAVALELILTGA